MWLPSVGVLRLLLLVLLHIHCCSYGVVASAGLMPFNSSGDGSGMGSGISTGPDDSTVTFILLPPSTSIEELFPLTPSSIVAVPQTTSVGLQSSASFSSPIPTIFSASSSSQTLPTTVLSFASSLRVMFSSPSPIPSGSPLVSLSTSTVLLSTRVATEIQQSATANSVSSSVAATSIPEPSSTVAVSAAQPTMTAASSTSASSSSIPTPFPTPSFPPSPTSVLQPDTTSLQVQTAAETPSTGPASSFVVASSILALASSATPVQASTSSEPTFTTIPISLPLSSVGLTVQVSTSSSSAVSTPSSQLPESSVATSSITRSTAKSFSTTIIPSALLSPPPSISSVPTTSSTLVPLPDSSGSAAFVSSEAPGMTSLSVERSSTVTDASSGVEPTFQSPTPSPPGEMTDPPGTTEPPDDETDEQGGGFLDNFMNEEVLITVSVGVPLILILLGVIIAICICSKVKKRRKSRKLILHSSNPSIFTNGKPRFRRRPSNGSLQAHELNFIQVEDGPSQHGLSQAVPVELEMEDYLYNGETSHGRSSEIPTGASIDPFHEPLSKLTPLSYPSQVLGFHSHLSDNPERLIGPTAAAIVGSSSYGNFPHSSPSLSVPTRMGISLQHEESKSQSLQGSKVSIPGPGSRTQSYQGSKASFLGSRASMPGSRSSSFPTTSYSREELKTFEGRREFSQDEEDALSLQFSGRTISPLLRSNSSFEDSGVPTRDSPMPAVAPLATSHMIGHGKKDFASLTCIPNYQAMEEGELGFQELHLSPSPELETHIEHPVSHPRPRPPSAEKSVSGGRRKSSSRVNLGALTTVPGQEPKAEVVEQPQGIEPKDSPKPASLQSERQTESPPSAARKPRSRAMSRLEKLTSLDYIRASLRLRKKKVSFDEKPTQRPSTRSTKSKPDKPNHLTFTNATALEREEDDSQLPNPFTDKDPTPPQFGPEYGDDPYSPALLTDDYDIGVPFQRHFTPRAQPHGDPHNPYFQLSQPTYQMPQFQYAYPQLSQQYYPPQQAYQPPPHPSQMGSNTGSGTYGRRYSDVPTHPPFRHHGNPEHFPLELASPTHSGRYRSNGSPHSFLETNTSVSDRFSATRSPDRFTESTNMSDRFRPISPDRYTDTSESRYTDTSDSYYDTRSPDRFTDSNIGSGRHFSGMTTPDRLVDGGYRQDRYRERTPDHLIVDHAYGRPLSGSNGRSHDHLIDRRRSSVLSDMSARSDMSTRPYNQLIDRRRSSVLSDASARSDRSVGKSRGVSWKNEVIEYTRTPSDQSEPEYDVL